MKTASIKIIKDDLKYKSQEELLQLCLRLANFKKENKELLTYLLFEEEHQESYIQGIKEEIDRLFEEINTDSYFYIRKSVRKILRLVKKYIRYSKNKETEAELLLYFCDCLFYFKPSIKRYNALSNLYRREYLALQKKIHLLHEDLQYDYTEQLEKLFLPE